MQPARYLPGQEIRLNRAIFHWHTDYHARRHDVHERQRERAGNGQTAVYAGPQPAKAAHPTSVISSPASLPPKEWTGTAAQVEHIAAVTKPLQRVGSRVIG